MHAHRLIFSLMFTLSLICNGNTARTFPITKHRFDPLTGNVTLLVDEVQKIIKEGGSLDSLLTISSQNDLIRIAAPEPKSFTYNKETRNKYGHKFAVDLNGRLNVALPTYAEKKKPGKNIHHYICAKSDTVISAGAIFVFQVNQHISKIFLVNRSSFFCPSSDSMQRVVDILADLGISRNMIERIDQPNPDCKHYICSDSE